MDEVLKFSENLFRLARIHILECNYTDCCIKNVLQNLDMNCNGVISIGLPIREVLKEKSLGTAQTLERANQYRSNQDKQTGVVS
jgi:hypothetical protein